MSHKDTLTKLPARRGSDSPLRDKVTEAGDTRCTASSSLCVIVLTALLGTCAVAKAQPGLRQAESQFRADTSLVLVPVTVTDFRSANINGLGKESFAVLDDGRPQPISVFYMEDAPCSVGIVLDVSGSMRNSLSLDKAAVHAFLEASNPEDDYFFVTVSSNPGVITGPVSDTREIDDLARSQNAGGGTALFDTIYFALSHERLRQKRRRALFVVSDGMDNHSRYSKNELMRTLMESDTQVYTIAVAGTRRGVKGIEWAEIQRGLAFMDDIAAKSGGVSVRLGEQENPAAAATRLASALRNQYVIGYRNPDGDQSGKWHRVQVKVNRSKVNVYARSGYQSR
ncbi:MAG TPA: VWA domain-containing protein [Bryobacteraceae bacterium]|nr:VWA domain-containing protein [Bryobacteraceae bacterium]